jgi:uncharacterized protein
MNYTEPCIVQHTPVQGIPAVLYGKQSQKLYLSVHGKFGCKEDSAGFAQKAELKGYQTLAFDLPEHGERKDEHDTPCNIWNGMRDLRLLMDYAKGRWMEISVYAVSLGAFFSLMTYQQDTLHSCLFLSPVLDMEKLIRNMMAHDAVSEQELREKTQIPSSSGERLDWNYYEFVRNNPVKKWTAPTSILYGEHDALTDRTTAESFSEKFGCRLTVAENCEHWFHTPEQLKVLDGWLDNVL